MHEKALEQHLFRSARVQDKVRSKRIHLDSYQSDDTEGHLSALQSLRGGEQDSESPLFKEQEQAIQVTDLLPAGPSIMALIPVDTNDAFSEYKNVEGRESLPEFDSNFQITCNSTQVPDLMWIEDVSDFDCYGKTSYEEISDEYGCGE